MNHVAHNWPTVNVCVCVPVFSVFPCLAFVPVFNQQKAPAVARSCPIVRKSALLGAKLLLLLLLLLSIHANFFSISVQCATAQRHKRPTVLLKLLKSLKWKFGLFITFTETVPLFVLLLLLLVLLLDNLKSEEEEGKEEGKCFHCRAFCALVPLCLFCCAFCCCCCCC